MKLVTYQVDQKVKIGIISADGEWVYPMDSIGVEYPTMLEAVKQMCESEKQLLEYSQVRNQVVKLKDKANVISTIYSVAKSFLLSDLSIPYQPEEQIPPLP